MAFTDDSEQHGKAGFHARRPAALAGAPGWGSTPLTPVLQDPPQNQGRVRSSSPSQRMTTHEVTEERSVESHRLKQSPSILREPEVTAFAELGSEEQMLR